MKEFLAKKMKTNVSLTKKQQIIHENIIYNALLLKNNFKITTITSIQQYSSDTGTLCLDKINGFSKYFNTNKITQYTNLF